MSTHTHEHGFLPAAGHRLLTPVYDVLSKLAGTTVVHARLVDLARLEPGHRVLDLGCGPGAVALRVADQHPEASVIGMDPDPDVLGRARGKAERAGLGVVFQPGFAEDLPFDDDSFDRVVSSLAFHHIDGARQLEAAAEVRRVLRPDGLAVIADIQPEQHTAHGLLGTLLGRTGAVPEVPGVDIAGLLGQAGFEKIEAIGHEELRIVGTVRFVRAAG